MPIVCAIYDCFGGPDVLAISERDIGPLEPGHVRIKVAGAGLNPVDAKLRSGALDGIFPLSFPVVPGWDVSGIVDAVGSGADVTWIGKRVFAYARYDSVGANGTCAQICDVPEHMIAEAPEGYDLAELAAVPLVALTAYQSMVVEGKVRAGQTVLILAGGGAVGHFALQIAAAKGASVVTTANPRDHAHLRGKGAAHCIDYRAQNWPDLAAKYGKFDIILDAVGGESLAQCYGLLAQEGCLIGLNDPPDESRLPGDARGVRLFSMPHGEQLSHIAEMLSRGDLKLDDVDTLPLSKIEAAHARLDTGHKGKMVVQP